MYNSINTKNDVAKEGYILNCELSGQYGFPQLEPIHACFDGLRPVPFNKAISEKKPRECVCHFFIEDMAFERIWNNCDKYLDILQNFKYVCSPDFSFYSDMPKTMQIWQTYRNRALGYYLSANGISVIPTVGWGFEGSFDWCFDGLPQNSTLAVSTNGCFSKIGKECYKRGFEEMCRRLNLHNVLVVGREIEVDADVPIIYMDSYGQEMSKKLVNLHKV